jgi:hypothetical protein
MSGVRISGLFFMARTRPQASTAGNGAFVVQWLAYDRQAPHKTIPWRFVWSGAAARAWWAVHADRLAPGTPIEVTGHTPDILRPPGCAPEIMLRVSAAPHILPGRWDGAACAEACGTASHTTSSQARPAAGAWA